MGSSNVFSRTLIAALVLALTACERDFDIELKDSETQLVVEAYINNEMPLYNYVVLSRSRNYYEPGFEGIPVRGAIVTVTEGNLTAAHTYHWDMSTKKRLLETSIPQVPGGILPGVYLDPDAVNDPEQALSGKPGKHYLLEIQTEEGEYSAITMLPQPVMLDSISSGNYFVDSIYTKARLTIYYQDPDTTGNTQLFYWRDYSSRDNFGWGGLDRNRFLPGTDDLANGQYMRLTPNNGFEIGDSVQFHLISVERKVYNFWDSYSKALTNDGPFATPVRLQSTIQGKNVIGCFSGFSSNTKTVLVK